MTRKKKKTVSKAQSFRSDFLGVFDKTKTNPKALLLRSVLASVVGVAVLFATCLALLKGLDVRFSVSLSASVLAGLTASIVTAGFLYIPLAQITHWLKKCRYGLLAIMLCLFFVCVATASLLDGVHISKTSGQAITFDEISLLPNGYFYQTTGTYYTNPEHPPLVKDIAALPFHLLNAKPPAENISKEVLFQDYAQYYWGKVFLFQSGNDTEVLIFTARLFTIIANAALLFLLYISIKKAWSRRAGVVSLFLLVTSPFVIGHGAIVTVDFMATMFSMLTLVWFSILLQRIRTNQPYRVVLSVAATCLAGALVSKFSTILLVPVLVVFGLGYILATSSYKNTYGVLLRKILKGVAFFVLALGFITLFYAPHVVNMPGDDIGTQLHKSYDTNRLPDVGLTVLEWTTELGVFGRAFAEFSHGVLMINNRIYNGAGSVYFMGEYYGTEGSGPLYFPVLYLAKLQIAYHVLSMVAIIGLFFFIKKETWRGVIGDIVENPLVLLLGMYSLLFAIIAGSSTLQIGLRHILPVIFALTILTGIGISRVIGVLLVQQQWQTWTRVVILGFAVWMIGVVLVNFPHYLSSYNKFAGGTSNGYKIATDSNYDWGQDVKRLAAWRQENNIHNLHVDLFVNPFLPLEYYLGPDVKGYQLYKDAKLPPGSYLAVSAQQYQTNVHQPLPADKKYSQYDDDLVIRISNTIFVYRIPSN